MEQISFRFQHTFQSETVCKIQLNISAKHFTYLREHVCLQMSFPFIVENSTNVYLEFYFLVIIH